MRLKTYFTIFVLASTLCLSSSCITHSEETGYGENLERLESFLCTTLYDPSLRLVRESSKDRYNVYWLLSDNLLAYNALQFLNRSLSEEIRSSLQKYGYLTNGLHEVLLGGNISFPIRTATEHIIEKKENYTIKLEKRDRDGKMMDDWTDYADLLLYASLAKHNVGDYGMALYYFDRAKNMWNDIGIYDKPTRQDGFYVTGKLALLLYVSRVLNQPLPFRVRLEEVLWKFQREDGGIRSHYLGNLTSDRDANAETASLVLIAYMYRFEEDEDLIDSVKEMLTSSKVNLWYEEAHSLFRKAQEEYDIGESFFSKRIYDESITHCKNSINYLEQAVAIQSRINFHTSIFVLASFIILISTLILKRLILKSKR